MGGVRDFGGLREAVGGLRVWLGFVNAVVRLDLVN